MLFKLLKKLTTKKNKNECTKQHVQEQEEEKEFPRNSISSFLAVAYKNKNIQQILDSKPPRGLFVLKGLEESVAGGIFKIEAGENPRFEILYSQVEWLKSNTSVDIYESLPIQDGYEMIFISA